MNAFIGIGVQRRKESLVLDVRFPSLLEMTSSAGVVLDEFLKRHETNDHPSPNGKLVVLTESLQSELKDTASDLDSVSQALLARDSNSLNPIDFDYSKSELVVYSSADLQSKVQDTIEAYFRLQLVSQRLCKPHELSFENTFGSLQNIAWTNYGPVLAGDLEEIRISLLGRIPEFKVFHLDKFPYLLDYHIPDGTRVVDGTRARLGAHLSNGTTIMPAGFVNFNAGTLGPAMIEGRVSAGVVVGANSDIGGGASIMGTLSGGNQTVISIAERCLLGANAGTGIPLGDGCTIEAGLYVTAGSPVALFDNEKNPVDIEGQPVKEGENLVKARELSGKSGLLFYRDSNSGQIRVRPNPRFIEINQALHQND